MAASVPPLLLLPRQAQVAAASAKTGSGRLLFPSPLREETRSSQARVLSMSPVRVACGVSRFAFRVWVWMSACVCVRGGGVDPIKSGVTAAGYRISAKEEVTLSSLTQEVRSPGRMQQCTIGVRKASRSSVLPRHAQRQRFLPRHAQQQRLLPRYAQQQERLNV